MSSTVQEAQANPSATEIENDVESDGAVQVESQTQTVDDERECTFIGNDFEFDED